MKRNHSVMSVTVLLILFFCPSATSAEEPLRQQLIVDESRIVVENFIADPDLESFRGYLKRAKGLLIVPDMYKGAWFIGGAGGRGILIVRDDKTGRWYGPAFYTMGSVSFGLQFGGEKSEIIILVMTQKGIESLLTTSIKLGGDVSIAAGPVGVGAQGATAPSLNVDYISFARSKGAFIGLSLDGAVIKENYDWNKAYYGKPVRPVNILVERDVSNALSVKLRNEVDKIVRSLD